jgi:hypothetical protein
MGRSQMTNVPPQRVSPIASPDKYALPGRPEGASPAALDAYRQTQFVLGSELALFEEAMNLQLRLVKDAYPSRYRTHGLAAIMGLWSRAYSYLTDGLLLMVRGSYASVVPLVRAACEVVSAQEGLRGGEMDEHTKWLLATLHPDETVKAFEFELGRYFAGGVIAADPVLRSVYRPTSELSRPNFGATLLQVGPETNNLRIALIFADASFHLGWAELALGWLLALAARQSRLIIDADPLFPVSAERRSEYEDLQARIDAVLERPDRCRIDEIDLDSNRRYLVQNFRRAPGGAPKKILL